MTRETPFNQRTLEQLKKGREGLLSDPASQRLLSAIRRAVKSETRNIYFIYWTPEQGEDVFDVLVDGTTIVRIEMPRHAQSGETLLEKWSVEEYLRVQKPGKAERRKLELALRLAESESA